MTHEPFTATHRPRRVEEHPPVTDQADLEAIWADLMGPLGFGSRRLWLLFLDSEDRCTPLLIDIEETPPEPTARHIDNLMAMVAHVITDTVPGGSVAFLISGPGRQHLSDPDRRWSAALLAGVRRAGLRYWPVHVANDASLRVVTPDDLS